MLWKNVIRPRSQAASRTGFRPQVDSLEDRLLLTTLRDGFVEIPVASGLNRPTAFEFAPDGRIFVAQQSGVIRVVKDDQLLPTPFLNLNVTSSGERGLLGIAFDPNFATNSYLYAYYTVADSPIHNRVSRFTANGDVVVPGSEVPIFELDPLAIASNHNGGAIHFGPDGKLYIGVGDNLDGANSQSMSNLLGKMLRINSDGSIPTDNPFYQTATGQNRAIGALGLRNPFSFAFQPGTETMFINDVGLDDWEEINVGIAGANYGWPATEGPTADLNFRSPLFAYQHGPDSSFGTAITGGTFYNPPQNQFPAGATGSYFFTDLGGSWIYQLDPKTLVATEFATGLPFLPVALGVDHAGSLYYLAIGGGADKGVLNKIEYQAAQAPTVTRQPTSFAADVGRSAEFSVEASGSGDLTYQWQRNGAAIPGATGPTLTIPVVSVFDLGVSYRVVISNSYGTTVSQPAELLASSPYARALYRAVFHRQPEPAALSTFTLALNQGATPGQLALALVTSPERYATTVVATYQATLGRLPTDAESAESFNRLSSGTSRDSLRAILLSSPEYAARLGGDPQRVAQGIYQALLGRAPRRAELTSATSRVAGGGTGSLVDFLNASNEARRRLVTNLYASALRQQPTPGQVRSVLLQLRRGLTLDQAEAQLLSSREFLARNRVR